MGSTLRQPTGASNGDSVRAALVAFWKPRRMWVIAVFAGALALALLAGRGSDRGSLAASLSAVLERDGLALDVGSLVWLEDDPGPLRGRPVLFLANAAEELPDLYYAEVRAGGSGVVLDVAFLRNLSRTSSAAEQRPVRLGHHVMFASHVQDQVDALVLLDLRGEPAGVTGGWPGRARLQNRITNLQETGRTQGFGRVRYVLEPAAADVWLRVSDDRFVAVADGVRIVIDPARTAPLEGAERVEVQPMEKGQPGTITWLVDTVRNLPFVGSEPIAWLEHRVYGVKDWAERTWFKVAGTAGAAETEAQVAAALGLTVEETRRRLALTESDPETGWPPAPLDPVLPDRVRGEGEWMAITDDPFVASYPNAPPPFYQTFLRVDPERLYVRVYLVAFDPRQLQLRIMSGTQEPVSATGATAPGMVPREPEVLDRLVAGFNGGFQALHGEFGMMSDGRVYLPPKPWSATVAVMDDGQVAMGSWLAPPERFTSYLEEWALRQVPTDMVDFRQNLTSVVEDGKYNPWKRWYWGAAPLNSEQQTYIARSGLCLTEEGFLVYFWGESMGSEQLGAAMTASRCVRGMHLDMNTPHTGFELYDVRPAGAPHAPLGRPLEAGEWEGPLPRGEGFVARSRLAVRSMDPMRFPRYLQRDPRDFFYLTLKPVLPGPDLPGARTEGGEGRFTTTGLPHAGWPHAFARTWLGGADGERTWIVRMDPRRVGPPGAAPARAHPSDDADDESATPSPAVLAHLTGALAAQGGGVALYATRARIGWTHAVGRPPKEASVLVRGAPLERVHDAAAAMGVDADGFLVYAERQEGDRTPLAARMAQAGVEHAVALPDGVRLALLLDGHHVSPDAYEREVDVEMALPLVARTEPAARVLFPEVRPRPYGVWARMQDTRVRYFKGEASPRFRRYVDGGVEP
jgi:hypothetical protein